MGLDIFVGRRLDVDWLYMSNTAVKFKYNNYTYVVPLDKIYALEYKQEDVTTSEIPVSGTVNFPDINFMTEVKDAPLAV